MGTRLNFRDSARRVDMKQCSVCAKPAVYHVTVLKEGDVKELHFCEQHFHEYMNKPDGATPEEAFIDSLLPESELDQQLAEADQVRCPNCGISYREFRESGRFGCPHDYTAFRERLLPLLENIHNAKQHRGKIPRRSPLDTEQQFRLIQLRKDLSEAVEAEDYERAAQLRDEIQSLEEELRNAK
ncbi:DNA helicase UvrBC [bacterium]|nr:DNA helicase UvrBC [bacterium]